MISKSHNTHCIHGNLVNYQGLGILITGAPGSGKSWVSAYLIRCGASLIADDMILLYSMNGMYHGQIANPRYRGLLYLRNHGFIAVPTCPDHSIPIHKHILLSAGTRLRISGSS